MPILPRVRYAWIETLLAMSAFAVGSAERAHGGKFPLAPGRSIWPAGRGHLQCPPLPLGGVNISLMIPELALRHAVILNKYFNASSLIGTAEYFQ